MTTNRIAGANNHANGHDDDIDPSQPVTWADLEDFYELIAQERVSREDVLAAGRAVYDKATQDLRKEIDAAIKSAPTVQTAEVTMAVAKTIEAEVQKALGAALAAFKVEAEQRLNALLHQRVEAAAQQFGLRQQEHEAALREWCDQLLASMRESDRGLLEQVAALLQAQAAPVINLPELPQPPAPVVNVAVPRRKVTKSIAYGPDGRPESITEEEQEVE